MAELFSIALVCNTLKNNQLINELKSINYNLKDLDSKIKKLNKRKITIETQLRFAKLEKTRIKQMNL